MLTDRECRLMILRVACNHGVSPIEIATKLIDESDKQDMRERRLTESDLNEFVRVWKEQGCRDMVKPDYFYG